ncbi:CGNR zinc finger domain-containing protein [Kribbella sp. C-35]|uniref:CGNR zinc finger domain-containing protein n=1 Tax=Kribbella sp. C-35 TaxID=2789276 RepID=UPI00397D9231
MPLTFRSGSGRLCLDFLRTLRLRGQDGAAEELDSPEALAAWVAQLGPYPDDAVVPVPSDAVLRQARDVRESVHAVLAAARSGSDSPEADRALLNKAAGEAPPIPVLGQDLALAYTAPDPVGAVLAQIAREALVLATSSELSRVRECAGPQCGAWFLDTSRPGSRRWCSMDTCGNQSKKTTWRTKHSPA